MNNTKEYALSKKQEEVLKIYVRYFDKAGNLLDSSYLPADMDTFSLYPKTIQRILKDGGYKEFDKFVLNENVRPFLIWNLKNSKSS